MKKARSLKTLHYSVTAALTLALLVALLLGALSAEDSKANWTIDAKNGKQLPADGGEPWKAYLEMQKAVGAGRLDGVRKHMARSVRAEMDADKPEDAQRIVSMLKLVQPKNVRFVGGYASADKASLKVSGESPMNQGKRTEASVSMVKEDGSWKTLNENWTS